MLSILSISISCLFLNLVSDSTVISTITDKLTFIEKKKVTSHIEYSGFLDLCKEVESHRADRLISWKTFLKYSKDSKTIILDTRSREKFNLSHIKGAINLPFSEFTTQALYKATGYNPQNRILIYCNNNFLGDQIAFTAKAGPSDPPKIKSRVGIDSQFIPNHKGANGEDLLAKYKNLVGNGPSLALNLPTYITLYGYGYENVYELADLLHVDDKKVKKHLESNATDFIYIDGVKVEQISVR